VDQRKRPEYSLVIRGEDLSLLAEILDNWSSDTDEDYNIKKGWEQQLDRLEKQFKCRKNRVFVT
jgi:DNA-binding HxlR family transcriptional regulator